jgi:hypothetical protein
LIYYFDFFLSLEDSEDFDDLDRLLEADRGELKDGCELLEYYFFFFLILQLLFYKGSSSDNGMFLLSS